MEVIALVREIITANEIGSEASLAYRFSDPDGERSGKSGYSFGRSQFDIENNWMGILCLKACGFRPKDMDRLFEQRGDITDLNTKLKAHSNVVDKYDRRHMNEALEWCSDILAKSNVKYTDIRVLLHVVDYHNQFYFSRGGKLHEWLKKCVTEGRTIAPPDILHFKLEQTAWGLKKPSDITRRFENVEEIYRRGTSGDNAKKNQTGGTQ